MAAYLWKLCGHLLGQVALAAFDVATRALPASEKVQEAITNDVRALVTRAELNSGVSLADPTERSTSVANVYRFGCEVKQPSSGVTTQSTHPTYTG